MRKNNKISKFLKIVFSTVALIIILLALAKLVYICHINKTIKMNKITIKEQKIHNILLNDKMYYSYKNIKIKNVFDTFNNNSNTNNNRVVLKDNNTNKSFGISLNSVDIIQEMKDSIFFKRINIYNKIDYYRYLMKNKNVHFFKYFDSIKSIINFNNITDILSTNEIEEAKITILNLDNNNVILMYTKKNASALYLYKNDLIYATIYFMNYNDDEIKDLISSIQY